MNVKIQFEARLPVVFKQEKNYVTACCPVLDVISQGHSRSEAKKNLGEALFLFFLTCYKHGTLDEVMKESGFDFLPVTQYQENESEHDSIDIQIPFTLPVRDNLECRA